MQVVYTTGAAAESIVAALAPRINAAFGLPVTASPASAVLNLTSKFAGESANELTISVKANTGDGFTYVITDPTGGAGDPLIPVDLGFNLVWETLVVNTLVSTNSNALDNLQFYGEGRIDPVVGKRFIAFTGSTSDDFTSLRILADSRRLDQVNALVVVENSVDLSGQIAADAAGIVARIANNNPATGYVGLEMQTTPGEVSAQFDTAQRDALFKNGVTYTYQQNNVQLLGDVATFYHPIDDPENAFKNVVNLQKLNQVNYRLLLEFDRDVDDDGWRRAALIEDADASSNRASRKPQTARAAAAAVCTALGDEGILKLTSVTNPLIEAEIDPVNADRININVPVILSGTARIFSIDNIFSFNASEGV